MPRLFARSRALRERGVLGINQRNAMFVLPLNPRQHYPRVDDKLLTKRLAQAGILTPTLSASSAPSRAARPAGLLAGRDSSFAGRGSQGNGIVVITGVEADGPTARAAAPWSAAALRQHVSTPSPAVSCAATSTPA
jgi:hypothetical protein